MLIGVFSSVNPSRDVRTAPCPNIIGSTRTLLQSSDSTSTGCFYDDVASFNRSSTSVATGNGWGKIYFSSKNSNSIYSGNDVQMNAFQLLIIIKVWSAGTWIFELSLNVEELLLAEKLITLFCVPSGVPTPYCEDEAWSFATEKTPLPESVIPHRVLIIVPMMFGYGAVRT